MTCINSLLESPLFSDFRMRNRLKIFIETKLGLETITSKDFNDRYRAEYFFNLYFLTDIIRDAKDYINFEHDVYDPELQTLFFLFLIHSLNQFPDEASWISFLDEADEIKTQHIIEGVSKVWLDFQTQLIQGMLFMEVPLEEDEDIAIKAGDEVSIPSDDDVSGGYVFNSGLEDEEPDN